MELDSQHIVIDTYDADDNPNSIYHIICEKIKGSYILLFIFYSLFLFFIFKN
jgi:hypothetical protein